jgi:transposase
MTHNVRAYNNKEPLLFPASIGDYLPEGHLAWVVDDVVDSLDLRCLYDKLSFTGNPSYHPNMMLKVLFYAYTQKTYSSRGIADKLVSDIAFIFLSGMQKPDFRTVSDFRKKNIKEICALFVQIVRLCKQLGMIDLGHVSIDSTVIKADASVKHTYSRDRIDKEEEKIKQAIDEYLQKTSDVDEQEDRKYGSDNPGDGIPDEVRDRKGRLEKIKEILNTSGKKVTNLTDADATFQRTSGKLVTGYRGQIAVDSKEQVIIASDVAGSSADAKHLNSMVDQAFQNTQREDDKKTIISADSAYSSMANLKELGKKLNIDSYIPDATYEGTKRGKKENESSMFFTHSFKYQPHNNSYLCPANQEIPFVSRNVDREGRSFSTYRGRTCKKCVYFGQCTTSPCGRYMRIYDDIQLLHEMRVKLDTPEGKSTYRKRMFTVEPVIGNIKHNLGFRRFYLRGINNVKAEFSLIAIGHNLLKIAGFIKKHAGSIQKSKYLVPVPT